MIVIATPTYNRSHLLIPTLRKLKDEAEDTCTEVTHLIYDDGSSKSHQKTLEKECERLELSSWYRPKLIRGNGNLGVKGHYLVVNRFFQEALNLEFDYFYSIHDDMIPCKHFLLRSSRHFFFVKKQDRQVVAMTLLSSYHGLWGTPRYIDGNYICTREFFNVLNWEVLPIIDTKASSGVNRQMTERFMISEKYRIAKAPGVSYLQVPRVDSEMFPPEKFPKRPNQADAVGDYFIDLLHE